MHPTLLGISKHAVVTLIVGSICRREEITTDGEDLVVAAK